jgi:hypothetical protein
MGIVTCIACLCRHVEPPRLLVDCTLAAILLCALTLLCLPAIAVP